MRFAALGLAFFVLAWVGGGCACGSSAEGTADNSNSSSGGSTWAGSSSAAGGPWGGSSSSAGGPFGVSSSSGGPSGTGGQGGASGSAAASQAPPDASGAPHAGSSGGAASGSGQTPSQDAGTPPPMCDVTNPVVLYLSADDSNSMAGAAVARGIINQGQLVYKGLRTYEFLNYYNFDYPPAEPGHVRVSAAMREVAPGTFSLQLGVRAPDLGVDARRGVTLTLAFDTSSSMGWGRAGETGLDRARAVCRAIAGSLRAGDTVSLVTWGGAAQTVLAAHHVTGPADAVLLAACQALQAHGTSDLNGGLTAAYALAQASLDVGRINRVVLVSDGGANVGVTERELIAQQAGDANGEAIYLLGVGVGDPWNYNDRLMDAVTDAGKGAYVFMDSAAEAERAFRDGFIRHVEVAARDVRVEVTLPPSFKMQEFHGEEYSTDPEEVEPQHLAMNDAMVFNQVVHSCAPETLSAATPLTVVARYAHPITRAPLEDSLTITFGELLAVQDPALVKGEAVVAFAEALKALRELDGVAALAVLDATLVTLNAAHATLPADAELSELITLLGTYRRVFTDGQTDVYGATAAVSTPVAMDCSGCTGVGDSLEAMRCAVDLCDPNVVLEQDYRSPSNSVVAGTHAAVTRFGASTNDLAPRVGSSYALMATGTATGTQHSRDCGGAAITDTLSRFQEQAHNVFDWRLRLRAPAGANGLRIHHLFLSEEYDEYVGSVFNDKFYILLEAGSTNGAVPTVINYTACRHPEQYHDFVCSPGMQYCTPRERYCYIAINTAASECCWLDGCPGGTATTDIGGTGFECAAAQGDSAASGSSTGWMVTEWPIEPGEEFTLTFRILDTGDGIYDSEAILDGIQFLDRATPGTRSVPM